jgi:hypothetical protein
MEHFSNLFISSQTSSPLIPKPLICGLFFPERELADERGVPVILQEPATSLPLRKILLENPDIDKVLLKCRCMELAEKMASMGFSLKGFLDGIEVEQDASVRITNYDRLMDMTHNLDEDQKRHIFDAQLANFAGELGQLV